MDINENGELRPQVDVTAEMAEGHLNLFGELEFFTLGVYGWDAEHFFTALSAAHIDTFCDVRARRGVRGSEYVFANSQRLQAALAQLGIKYIHRPDLAPGKEIRSAQRRVDAGTGEGQRGRSGLSQAFIDAYLGGPLANFDSAAFVTSLGHGAHRVVLFCVECEPAACHRGLLAEALARDLSVEVTHLTP